MPQDLTDDKSTLDSLWVQDQIAALVVNYGISNTIVLEMP